MRKVYLLTGLMALASLTYAENNLKWTGQIVPRVEIEDTNNYGPSYMGYKNNRKFKI